MEKEEKKVFESYLSFNLGDEIFAVNVRKVLEVLEMQYITKVPRTPDFIRGVINFRGEILPVFDSRMKFNLQNSQDTGRTVIIVLELKVNDKMWLIGAIADGVRDVLEISKDQIRPVPELGSKYNTDFLLGMIRSDTGFLMVLDIDKVFSVDELTLISNTVDAEAEHIPDHE